MKLRCLHIICLVCFAASTFAQQRKYTVGNAHSHNDYVNPEPFYTAYKAGFGSIEADIFLKNGKLYVAHDSVQIKPDRTLEALYLDPLWTEIMTSKGSVYPEADKELIFLVDIKTAAEPTLDTLLAVLSRSLGRLVKRPGLKIVITGNRPAAAKWSSYPGWLYFDGRLNERYDSTALTRVALISDNFRFYSSWKGEGELNEQDVQRITAAVNKAHQLRKPIRFWATPDNPAAWRQLMQLNVDYINTDKITELAEFLGNKRN